MSYMAQRKLGRKIASVAIGAAAMLVVNSGMALAAYGPLPPPTPVPGGFYCVVTSQTVGQAGKVIGPVRLRGLTATLRVRPDSFPIPAPFQITITQPASSNGGCRGGGPGIGGFPGYHIVGGIGIFIQQGGSAFKGSLRRPLILTLSPVSSNSRVVVWNGKHFVDAPNVVIRNGVATVPVEGSGDYLVLAPGDRIRSLIAAAAHPGHPASAASRQATDRELLGTAFPMPTGWLAPGLGVVTDSSYR